MMFGIQKPVASMFHAARRMFGFQGTVAMHNYGRHDSTLTTGANNGSKFPGGLTGGIHRIGHSEVRRQARSALQDSPQARAIVERKTDAVAYTGLRLEPTPDTDVLGMTKEQATIWGRDVSARFDLWATDKKQNRSGTISFAQAQWMYTFYKERDNDIFVRLYYTKDKQLQNPLQFSFIDPNQIQGHESTSTYGIQYTTHNGIVRDARGRAVAYTVLVLDADNRPKIIEIPAKAKGGRLQMLHGFRGEYAGQTRGYSKLAPILQELQNFTDFSLAHIQQAIAQAMIMGFIEPGKDEDALEIFTPDNVGAAGPSANLAEVPGTDGVVDHGLVAATRLDIPEDTRTQPGSVFVQNLAKDQKITFAKANAPITTYPEFQEAFLQSLAAAVGIPLEVVHMKFQNNFSASRATLLLFQRIVDIEREDMVTDFNAPVYKMWISEEIAAGRITAPGWSDPRLQAAWLKATWRGAPVPDIDPAKLAKARRDNIDMGVTSVERESQQHSNRSAADNIADNNLSYEGYEKPPYTAQPAAIEVEQDES